MTKKGKLNEAKAPNTEYSQLRAEAEQFLYDNSLVNTSDYNRQVKDLFQELQVHQIELEMQNDELRLTNLELERQKAKFAGMYNLAPVGYFVLDHSGVIADVNDTGMSLLETGKAGLVGRRLHSFVDEPFSDEFYRFIMRMQKSAAIQTCNLAIKTSGGKKFHAQVSGLLSKTGEGPAESYIAVVDITNRINTEMEIAEIKDRLELSLKASQAGTWELDPKTLRFYMDEGTKHICSLSDCDFSGSLDDFTKLIHPDDRRMVESRFRAALLDHEYDIDLLCRFGEAGMKECYTVIRGHLIPTKGAEGRFVGIIMDITEKTLIERSTDLLKEQYQQRIASATILTEENERKRISAALHDSVSQLLYGIKIQLGQLEKGGSPSSNLKTVKKLVEEAIEETRNISFELAPSILTDFGLPATIEELVKRLSSNQCKMNVKIKGLGKRMDLLLETNIYRIVQELINNCMKHSGASEIKIEISKNKSIDITVEDNGVGFDVKEQDKSTSGSGLSSIRNRLRIYDGQLLINSKPGKGTAVQVKLFENIPAEK